jgi:hypothetical protein
VQQSIAAAASAGARVLIGGERDGSMVAPTVVGRCGSVVAIRAKRAVRTCRGGQHRSGLG